jgi:hypothetical protein
MQGKTLEVLIVWSAVITPVITCNKIITEYQNSRDCVSAPSFSFICLLVKNQKHQQ